jgi:SAM-dependent methyltransferase
VINANVEPLWRRLYEAYASQHAGFASRSAAALAYRREIRAALPPPPAGPVADIGCGQGELVRLLLADGYCAVGVDISPEQVALGRAAGVQGLREGDYSDFLAESPCGLAAVVATDPFGGNIRYGDFAHGLASAARLVVWKAISSFWKLALAAETGVLRGHIVTQNLTFAARKGLGRDADAADHQEPVTCAG